MRSLTADLATTLHDHAISDALDEATADLESTDLVGVMGGRTNPPTFGHQDREVLRQRTAGGHAAPSPPGWHRHLPGRAGTVQEIFQAVTENFYAANRSQVAPMILVDYWTNAYPAWPLPQRLGEGKAERLSTVSTTCPQLLSC